MKRWALVLPALVLSCIALPARSVPITITETVVASGSLGSATFTDAQVTLQGVGDTVDVFQQTPNFYVVPLSTFTVLVSGVGSATMTGVSALSCWANACLSAPPFPNAAAGFGVPSAGRDVLDIVSAAFDGYDLTKSIGPITGPSLINAGFTFDTSGGLLVLQSAGGVTFSASVEVVAVPEPSSAVLLALGLLVGLTAVRFHRHRRR